MKIIRVKTKLEFPRDIAKGNGWMIISSHKAFSVDTFQSMNINISPTIASITLLAGL